MKNIFSRGLFVRPGRGQGKQLFVFPALLFAWGLLVTFAACADRDPANPAASPGIRLAKAGTAKPRQRQAPAVPQSERSASAETAAQIPPAPEPETVKNSGRVRIAAAGDVMLQRRCNRSARQRSLGPDNNDGYDELFPGLGEAFSDSDIAFANMEFPVFDQAMPEREMVFHGTTPVLNALKKAGFSILNAANNHSYDQGPKSPDSTAAQCAAAGMPCLGVGANREQAQAPHMVEKNGVKLAFIGFTMLFNSNYNRRTDDSPRVNGKDWKDLLGQVEAAAAVCDGVVVTLHWGQEYRTAPLRWQYSQARELGEAGACLIIGHHPHVLEPIELFTTKSGRRVLTAYSLGNFLSNQGGRSTASTTRIGAIVKVDLARTERGVEVMSWQTLPTWVENRNVRTETGRVEDVHVEVVPLMIRELEKQLEQTADEKEKASIGKRIAFYRGRALAVEKIVKHPQGEEQPPAIPEQAGARGAEAAR